jgi:hypothetical protein
MWSSVQGKSYTLVILVTLVFAVWNNGHHTQTKLVGVPRTTELVPCQAGSPCPPVSIQIDRVTTTVSAHPLPATAIRVNVLPGVASGKASTSTMTGHDLMLALIKH